MSARAGYVSKLLQVAPSMHPDEAEYSYPLAKGMRLIAAAGGGWDVRDRLPTDRTFSALAAVDEI